MQLTPHYGPDPLIELDGDPSAICEPTVRQRRRLAEALASFGDDEWNHPSRCEGWTNRDVVVHLDSTNTFWSFSIAQGLRGEPTQFLATFDPVATPAQLVAAEAGVPAAEVLERYRTSTEALATSLSALDADGWTTLAEAPPGHLTISALAHHALWDSWIHERDILLPLGRTPDVEADEVEGALRYVAGLAPAFAAAGGGTQHGVLGVVATDPDLTLAVEVDDRVRVRTGPASSPDLELRGGAVDLLEALSLRAPLDAPVPDEARWLIGGLAVAFDAA
jgi:uncharacterized protein (TIGR03083 family)